MIPTGFERWKTSLRALSDEYEKAAAQVEQHRIGNDAYRVREIAVDAECPDRNHRRSQVCHVSHAKYPEKSRRRWQYPARMRESPAPIPEKTVRHSHDVADRICGNVAHLAEVLARIDHTETDKSVQYADREKPGNTCQFAGSCHIASDVCSPSPYDRSDAYVLR